MVVLNPQHLIEQAERLASRSPTGAPRQADLRRGVSAAYYAVFHFVLASAANDLIGVTKQATARYRLVYRSIDHRTLRDVCKEARKRETSVNIRRYAPGGFGDAIRIFAAALLELQESRHTADYDPTAKVERLEATFAISTARSAIEALLKADREQRQIFLALLLFPAR